MSCKQECCVLADLPEAARIQDQPQICGPKYLYKKPAATKWSLGRLERKDVQKEEGDTEMLRVAMGKTASCSFHTLPTFDVQHKITKSVQSSHFRALLSGKY
jgi:hypothetical protein